MNRSSDLQIRTPWRRGSGSSAPAAADGVFVSYVDFRFHRLRDYPSATVALVRLESMLRKLPGSVGIQVVAYPTTLITGVMTAWRDEDALGEFIRLPYHVEIMRKFDGRGRARLLSFTQPEFSRPAAMAEVRRRLETSDVEHRPAG